MLSEPDVLEASDPAPRPSRPWLVPVVLGALLLVIGLVGTLRSPVGSQFVALERVTFEPNLVRVHLRNDGPDERIVQVLVNRAFWRFSLSEPTLRSRHRAVLTLEYPWDPIQPVRIELVRANGRLIPFSLSTASSTSRTPTPSSRSYLLVALTLAAVPAGVGLTRLASRSLGRTAHPMLAGLRLAGAAALAAAALAAGIASSKLQLSPSLSGSALLRIVQLVGIGFVVSAVLALWATRVAAKTDSQMPPVAYLVAVGIGVSNLAAGALLRHQLTIGSLRVSARLLVALALLWGAQSVVVAATLRSGNAGWGAPGRISVLIAGPVLLGLAVGTVLAGLAPLGFLAGWAAGILVVSLWDLVRDSQAVRVESPVLFAFGGLVGAGMVAVGFVAR